MEEFYRAVDVGFADAVLSRDHGKLAKGDPEVDQRAVRTYGECPNHFNVVS